MRLFGLILGALGAKMGVSNIIGPPPGTYEGVSCTGNPPGNVGFCVDGTKPETQSLCTSSNGFEMQPDSYGTCKVHTQTPSSSFFHCKVNPPPGLFRVNSVVFLRVTQKFHHVRRRPDFALIQAIQGK